MTQPETKTVLGRVFTWSEQWGQWECRTPNGTLALVDRGRDYDAPRFAAGLERQFGSDVYSIATDFGPTESDAILALQSTLRKMAELEVAK
jgi:hypothetical protein